jgi:quercetin dioxygenase-like cupin family protein
MTDYRIDLSELTWTDVAPGLKRVELATDMGTVQLTVFAPGFTDADWCEDSHLGYVLEGEAEVAFASGVTVLFKPGDIVRIPAGAKHKTNVGPDGSRILFFMR